MKPLSETYKEQGIAFTFPIIIRDANGYRTYFEDRDGWQEWGFDSEGELIYFEDSDGLKRGTPRSTTNQ